MFKKLLLPIAVIAAVGFATKTQAQVTLGTCSGNLTVSIDGSSSGLPLSATSAVTSNYNGAQISCKLASQGVINNGEITVTPNGGTSPYTYSKDGGLNYQSSAIFTGLTEGPYTLTVKDASGCTTTTSVSITAPLAIVAGTCTLTEDGCQLNLGSVKVEAGGGTGNLSVSWTASFVSPYAGPAGGTTPLVITDPSGTTTGTVTFTGLSGNTIYSFKITDANGCMLSN